ncbi:MAG TPA: aminotransferase class V-fold PLP-dependent enzyme [Thermodesulfobacteriota bacterium]|nr:aminotransferase class V-fold PLP-dependent enzyme [Thermodesulfobacteriota bacterium]
MASLRKIIYLDNAATTFPKPREVLEEMVDVYANLGVSPGRGSYDLSMEAEERVMDIRREVCQFFGGSDPERVIFSYNATDALNTLIQGLIRPNSRVVSSRLEHNSVLRPLHYFSHQGIIRLDLIPFGAEGFVDPVAVAEAIRTDTSFVILTHASNVLGAVQPVERIGAICRERGVPFVLDVTQTAGRLPIRLEEWGVSAIAFTGHKSLLGPTGIGGLVLSPGLDVEATRFGGTGRDSLSLDHTRVYPQRLEPGTINVAGIFGLSAGLRYISRRGLENICSREVDLAKRLHDGLTSISGVRVYPAILRDPSVAIMLCNVDGMDPEDLSSILDGDFGIAARAGLHCAPLVHEDLGTSPRGGVRFSLGPFNTDEDIDKVLEAMNTISRSK